MKAMLLLVGVLGIGLAALAQTTQPARNAAPSANDMLKDLLTPKGGAPLQPTAPLLPAAPAGQTDATSLTAIAPGAPAVALKPEGTWIYNRRSVLRPNADGKPELVYEADGQAQQDPPMLVLPNLKLMQMEMANKSANGQIKFIVSGHVTEYNGRNHILVEKVVAAGQK